MSGNPVKFSDLGKEAKDLLSKNFHFGVIKFEGKTKASGMQFTADGTHTPGSGKVLAGLETKSVWKDFTFTEKWTTDNWITAKAEVSDKLVEGLKMELDASFSPGSGDKAAVMKHVYAKDSFSSTMDMDLLGQALHTSAVFEHKGILAGVQASVDSSSSVATHSQSIGYHGHDLKAHLKVTDLSDYVCSIHQKVNGRLAAVASMAGTFGEAPTLTVGAQYAPDADSFYKAKLDNNLQVGLSYVSKLKEGVQLTLSSLIDGKALNGGGHQFGVGINLSA